MVNMNTVNKNVSSVLKNDYSEAVYNVWLFFTETAQFINNNIVLSVPNYFIKNIVEKRYLFDIEDLYRNELDFNKLTIELESNQTSYLKFETSKREDVLSSSNAYEAVNLIEKINYHIKNIYEYIEIALNSGYNSFSYTLAQEPFFTEEIYWQVKNYMINKGYKVNLESLDEVYTLKLAW